MIGAIVGDIAGSRFEFDNYRKKDFEIFSDQSFITDDTIMTLAIAKALTDCKPDRSDLKDKAVFWMQELGRAYPDSGYGGRFREWIDSDDPKPYNSYGNGAAMRVSAAGWAGKDLEEVRKLSDIVTGVTHNHPEGIKGARATAEAIYLARTGHSKDEIRTYVEENYYPLHDCPPDKIRDTYEFNETSQETVPQAIAAFLESSDFEDAIRTAVSVGGDSDTLAAITGSIAEAFYGVPRDIRNKAISYLDENLLDILLEAEEKLMNRRG